MFQTSLMVLQPIDDRLRDCEEIIRDYTDLFFQQEEDDFVLQPRPVRSFSLSQEGIDDRHVLRWIERSIDRNGETRTE